MSTVFFLILLLALCPEFDKADVILAELTPTSVISMQVQSAGAHLLPVLCGAISLASNCMFHCRSVLQEEGLQRWEIGEVASRIGQVAAVHLP